MDDGGSPHIGLIVLLLFLILHIVLYGCLSAMSNMNEGRLEKQAKEGDKRASLLLLLWKKPTGSVHTLQFIVTGLHLFAGVYVISEFPPLPRLCIGIVYWMLLLAFGMYAPMKIAEKKTERWGKRFCRITAFLTAVSSVCKVPRARFVLPGSSFWNRSERRSGGSDRRRDYVHGKRRA